MLASVSRPGRPRPAAHVFARARAIDRAVFFVFGFGKDVRWVPLS